MLFFIGVVFYTLTLRGVYGNPSGKIIKGNLDKATKPFELSPERGRYILTYSLGENGSFSLSRELADAASPDVGYYQGRFYVYFPPGLSIMALPFYVIGKYFNLAQVFSFAMVSLFATLNLLFIFKIARDIFRLPTWTAFLASLIFGFASTSWSYAVTLYQHHITTFLILSSFYFVWRFKRKNSNEWLLSSYIWFAYGISIIIDYPNALLMLPVMVYFLVSSIQTTKGRTELKASLRLIPLITSIVFVILVFLHGYYNYVNFGKWTNVSGSLVGANPILEQKVPQTKQIQATLEKLQPQKTAVGLFKEENMPRGVVILLFAIDKGIFLFTPIFLLALLGIFKKQTALSAEKKVFLAIILINIFLYSSFGDPWGGWAFGPRYLIPTMAILSIFLAIWLNNTKYKITSRIVAFILFIYSSSIALLGALTTNQVPPKIEADYLHMKYNFLLNYDYFQDGRSGSFIFNEYASRYVSLQLYFIIIWGVLLGIVLLLLFTPLLFIKKHES